MTADRADDRADDRAADRAAGPTADPAAAARVLADAVLRPRAEQVDEQGVQRGTLDALAAAGLMGVTVPEQDGGLGCPPAVQREVAEVLAGADGATWFVWTQHHLPTATAVASANPALRERVPRLARGELLSGVAFAHLRRPGPPAVTAVRDGAGWRFDGAVGWCSSWGLADVVLLGGLSPQDEVVFAFVAARDGGGVTASAPMRLAAMQASATVTLRLDGVRVGPQDVAQVTPAPPWREADRWRTANAGPHTYGLVAEAVHRLRDRGADALAARLAAECGRLRDRAYALLDDVPPGERLDERLQVRAASLELAVRATASLVTASGGGAMARSSPAQRLAREALFGLVQAQTPAVRAATLDLLSARSG